MTTVIVISLQPRELVQRVEIIDNLRMIYTIHTTCRNPMIILVESIKTFTELRGSCFYTTFFIMKTEKAFKDSYL